MNVKKVDYSTVQPNKRVGNDIFFPARAGNDKFFLGKSFLVFIYLFCFIITIFFLHTVNAVFSFNI